MKRRYVGAWVVAVGVVFSLTMPARAASAATCLVSGDIDFLSGNWNHWPLNETPRNATYYFSNTSWNCVGNADLNGVWFIDAWWATTGIPALEDLQGEGETCEHGRNLGPSLVSAAGGVRSFSGSGAFTRLGFTIRAAGTLTIVGGLGDGNTYRWEMELDFTPDGTQALGCLPGIAGGVTSAQTRGVTTVTKVP